MMGWYAAWIVGAALFPRLAYWARWPTQAGWRGRIANTAFNALMLFAAQQFAVRLRQVAAEHLRLSREA